MKQRWPARFKSRRPLAPMIHSPQGSSLTESPDLVGKRKRRNLLSSDSDHAHQPLIHDVGVSIECLPSILQLTADLFIEVVQAFFPVINAHFNVFRINGLARNILKNCSAHMSSTLGQFVFPVDRA